MGWVLEAARGGGARSVPPLRLRVLPGRRGALGSRVVVLTLAVAAVTGSAYEVTEVVEDYSREGASMSKVFVDTDAASEEDFREITDRLREQRYEDLLWVEFYDGSTVDTTGVVLDLDSSGGVEFGDGSSATGGGRGRGVRRSRGGDTRRLPLRG